MRALGHRFKNVGLLDEALTHASAGVALSGRDNERLEFLGDRVLGLVITELLIETYPHEPEGGLAPRLNALVRKETLAEVALAIGVATQIRLAVQDEVRPRTGKPAPAILADACEALIAALYLDGGLKAARRFIEAHWLARLQALAQVPRDAKTMLQEWAQGRGLAPPVYRLLSREGPDHAPSFTVSAEVAGLAPATADGASKRAAEQAAAAVILRREGIWSDSDG